ncbi:GNAT family N-acetyltransferase [Trinickia mobilis]|uniref:GNAT family N-acetyltransferase n=1 Tax=Trinickia mobilis TaxID=2816356 RepID=UPI001A8EEF4D|nr:GNAT family N-acetyltransferase [Trinickia mobilis]
MLAFRDATLDDLPAIVALLADDDLGAGRESAGHGDLPRYEAALRAIAAQPGNSVLLCVDGDEIAGLLQLTLIPGLSRLGMTRAQIEGVRVSRARRGQGIGERLFEHAIGIARSAGCGLVQLTTDKRRVDAKRFYERLGFVASHEGMKLEL